MQNRAPTSRGRRGVSLIYLTMMMLVLIGLASLGVDYGRVRLAKTELQQAVDAAARYGATGMSGGVSAVKTRVAAAALENKVDGTGLVIDQTNDIEFGTWDNTTRAFTVLTGAAQANAKAIRVTGRRTAARGTAVPLSFARVLGKETCDVAATCVMTTVSTNDDIFLIQDITTSFTDELPDAKAADLALLDSLNSGGGTSRLAVAVHTGWGLTLSPFKTITTNYSSLRSTISGIKIAGSSGMPAPSGTDIASGLDEAITAYSATGYVPPSGSKTVVLVSDGQPTSSRSGKHPTMNDSQLLALAATRANTLWANNVHVYIVFMDKDNDATAANNVRSLIRGNGIFVRVTNPALLPAALVAITNNIGSVKHVN